MLVHAYATLLGMAKWSGPHHWIWEEYEFKFHSVTCYTKSIVSRIHVNTTKLCNITYTSVATSVILRSLGRTWVVVLVVRAHSSTTRKMTSMLLLSIMVLLHFCVGLSSFVISKWSRSAQELETSEHYRLSKVSNLNIGKQVGWYLFSQTCKPLNSPLLGLKIYTSPGSPTMIRWTIGGRVHHKSSASKATYPSTNLVLGNLNLKFPFDLGFKTINWGGFYDHLLSTRISLWYWERYSCELEKLRRMWLLPWIWTC